MSGQLVPLTREIFERFHGEPPKGRVQGVAVVEDGEPVAVGAIALGESYITMFMDMLPSATQYPKLLLKGGRRVVEMARRYSRPVYAVQNEELESAPRFLAHLGFAPEDDLWRLQ